MLHDTQQGRTFIINYTDMTADVVGSECHTPGCNKRPTWGIATYFARGIPMAVVPLCEQHYKAFIASGGVGGKPQP
jgi:hypothetical protein